MFQLIRYCEGVIEAVWLAAVVSVPLFLNFHGERMESEKNYLLRSLALVLLAAWAVKTVGQARTNVVPRIAWRSRIATLLRIPLVVPTMIMAVALLASTLLSLSPDISFGGTHGRSLGSYSYFCCLVLFAALTATVRSERQVNRIITVAILTSIPISLYGIGQRFSIEPIRWLEGSDVSRVRSTLGQAIYLGAYLMMVQPLTLSRVLQHAQACISRKQKGPAPLLIYGLTAALQLCALVFTVSRGPLLGLVAGLFAMFLMLAIHWRKRGLVLGVIGTGILVGSALVLLSWRGHAVRAAVGRYEIQRLSEILNPKVGTGAERAAAWKVAANAACFAEFPGTGPGNLDSFSIRRFLFGYGPETVGPVSRLYALSEFNAALPNHDLFDRFHNEFWDTLITTGLLGSIAYLALTFSIVFYGCQWLGFMATSRQRTVFWRCFIGGGALGILALISWQGTGFVGVGLRLGTYLGLLAFLVWVAWRNEHDSAIHHMPTDRSLLVIALLSAIVAHPIEISFSFIFETSLLYFWTYAALLLLLGHTLPSAEASGISAALETGRAEISVRPTNSRDALRERVSEGSLPVQSTAPIRDDDSSPRPEETNQKQPTSLAGPNRSGLFDSIWRQCNSWRTEIIAGLLVALVWANLGVILIQKTSASSTPETLAAALTHLAGGNNAGSWILPTSLLGIWLVLAGMLSLEFRPGEMLRPWLRSFLLTLAVSGMLALVYWFVLAAHTTRMLPFRGVTLANVDRFLAERTFIVDFHYGFTLLLVLLLAIFLPAARPKLAVRPSRWTWLASSGAIAVAVGTLIAIHGANMRRSKIGIMAKLTQEEYFQLPEKRPLVAAIHEAAIQAVPTAENHHLALGQILIDQAAAAQNADEQSSLFLKAERVLGTGARLRPIDPAFPDRLGFLYSRWSALETDPDQKHSLARKSIAMYRQVTALDPGNFAVWQNIAQVQLFRLGSPDDAQGSLFRSIELRSTHAPAYGLLGSVYFQLASSAQDPGTKRSYFGSAATNFQRALALTGSIDSNASHRYSLNLGASRINLGELSEAAKAYQNALLFSPPADRWRHEETLARLLADLKDKTNAVVHLQRAIEQAPSANRPDLLNLKNRILESR